MTQVLSPADVAYLPWVGNAVADLRLFELVDLYIKHEPDLGKRQRAAYLASICGCGEDYEIDPNYDPRDDLP